MRTAALLMVALLPAAGPFGPGESPAYLTKIKPADLGLGDRFGVALDLDGSTILIGSPGNDSVAPDAGAVYVYHREGAQIVPRAKLVASDATAVDVFGSAVSLARDVALIGAWADDDQGQSSGSAYVFMRSGDAWSQRAKLVAPDGRMDRKFGSVVAADEDAVAVSTWSIWGSVYLFSRQGETWAFDAKLAPSGTQHFGISLDLQDGVLVVGSEGDDSARGAVYVYTRVAGSWALSARLNASDGDPGDRFGHSVALAADLLVVGAHTDGDAGTNAGSAYVFERAGAGWAERARLVPGDTASHQRFGEVVAASGRTVFVTSLADNGGGRDSGTVYVFSPALVGWSETARLVAPDGAPFDWFGSALAAEGDTLLAGSYGDDEPWSFSGSAHAFALPLGPPRALTAIPSLAGDALAWLPPTEDYRLALRYRVYQDEGQARTLLGETGETSFLAPGCVLGEVCTYIVTAVSSHAEGATSIPASAVGLRTT